MLKLHIPDSLTNDQKRFSADIVENDVDIAPINKLGDTCMRGQINSMD